MEYGKHLEQTILSEHRNHAAAHRLGLLQTDATSSAKSGADELQLFRFRNPGLVSFEIKGEMVGNQLDMVTWQIKFLKWMVALDRVKWNLQWGCRVFKNYRMIVNEHI